MEFVNKYYFNMRADDITQFFRGKVYITIDSILMLPQELTESNLDLSLQLFQTFIDLFINYLKCLPSFFEDVAIILLFLFFSIFKEEKLAIISFSLIAK